LRRRSWTNRPTLAVGKGGLTNLVEIRLKAPNGWPVGGTARETIFISWTKRGGYSLGSSDDWDGKHEGKAELKGGGKKDSRGKRDLFVEIPQGLGGRKEYEGSP